ncbi:hypothetical protein O9929_20840 [Vibrio lentus]|nr:hypothetical protein [Vibrio lentus]
MFAGLSLVIGDVYPDLDPSGLSSIGCYCPLYIFLPIVRGYNTKSSRTRMFIIQQKQLTVQNQLAGQWVVSIPLAH